MIPFRLAEAVASAVWPDPADAASRPGRTASRRAAAGAALGTALGPDLAGRLRARQVGAIVRLGPSLTIVNVANAAAFVAVLQLEGQGSPAALLWAGLVVLVAGWSLLRRRRAAGRPPPATCSEATVRRVIRSAGWFGVVWAVPGLTFLPGLTGFSLAFAAAATTGMIAGGALALYPIPAAGLAFMTPVLVGSIAGFWAVHGTPVAGLAILAAMFLLIFWSAIRRHAELFVAEFLARDELDRHVRLIEELLEDTRLELAGSRLQSQQRLAQAKKLAAVGQLTGGIAHDFNNLLTAIRGSAELMLDSQSFDSGLLRDILEVSDRGARQIQRLLAIAQKQTLRPRPIDLADLLADVRRVLEPSLGPDHPVRIETGAATPSVLADPAHLEGALISLAFNARDAMPDGGEIVIAVGGGTPDGTAGDGLVPISVADRGRGMSADVLEHATEPFFTTRKFGRGSGLGLATVAGFARQSGGDITIVSAPGAGTTVTMLLPAFGTGAATAGSGAGSRQPDLPPTVLVIEDDPEALPATLAMARALGYRALGAATAGEALDLVARERLVDVVLTDILLPGPMTGVQLAKALRRPDRGPAIAFMSAWARGLDDAAGPDLVLLGKPFTERELADHLVQALAGAPRPSPAPPGHDHPAP